MSVLNKCCYLVFLGGRGGGKYGHQYHVMPLPPLPSSSYFLAYTPNAHNYRKRTLSVQLYLHSHIQYVFILLLASCGKVIWKIKQARTIWCKNTGLQTLCNYLNPWWLVCRGKRQLSSYAIHRFDTTISTFQYQSLYKVDYSSLHIPFIL